MIGSIAAYATPDRIMDVAGELFAEQGFRQTSIRDICARANVNLAAVNYHFRDKDGLYEAILRRSLDRCVNSYPIADTEGTAEERLGAFVRMFLMRILGEGQPAWHGKLMAAELANPTGAWLKLVESVARPTHNVLLGIIRDYMNVTANTPQIEAITCSILGQCLFYRHSRPVAELLGVPVPASEAEIDALARHITQFSLSGLAGIRQVHTDG
ncbi:MAG: CerR family C-terminal domain-containing protein [Candidatus Hydrogenedentes bacterium]|nr:CerR family C-terminal domain-containing protein [Candidatus Hydrogenedentota bacterium]